jgi:hypothetical protein
MTKSEWLACTDPREMLEALQAGGLLSERKARLFAVACCRRIWHLLSDERSRSAVLVAERYADGLATLSELAAAQREANTAYSDGGDAFYGLRTDITPPHCTAPHAAALHAADPPPIYVLPAVDSAAYSVFKPRSFPYPEEEATAAVAPERAAQVVLLRDFFGGPFRLVSVEPAWLGWEDCVVVKLAQGVYDEHAFDRTPILADALEEAGCDQADLLRHLRGPGPHVRGCWSLDLLLGKE